MGKSLAQLITEFKETFKIETKQKFDSSKPIDNKVYLADGSFLNVFPSGNGKVVLNADGIPASGRHRLKAGGFLVVGLGGLLVGTVAEDPKVVSIPEFQQETEEHKADRLRNISYVLKNINH